MTALTYAAGVITTPVAYGIFLLWFIATERTQWSCRRCRWSTGWRGALSAWVRWRWHRHVTRAMGRCRP